MGLDVAVYDNLEFYLALGDEEPEDFDDANCIIIQAGPIDRLGEMVAGYYRRTEDTHRSSFRAGSYGGYNGWRQILCNLIHGVEIEDLWKAWDDYKGDGEFCEKHPFIELICFSDCEGIIGTDICQKLAQDFEEYEEILKEHSPDERWWYVYEEFMGTFQRGQDSGFVKFC